MEQEIKTINIDNIKDSKLQSNNAPIANIDITLGNGIKLYGMPAWERDGKLQMGDKKNSNGYREVHITDRVLIDQINNAITMAWEVAKNSQ